MWYTGTDQINPKNAQIGRATSGDGKIWVRLDPNNPVLRKGAADDWDGGNVTSPMVIYEPDASPPYKMWYCGQNKTNQTNQTKGGRCHD